MTRASGFCISSLTYGATDEILHLHIHTQAWGEKKVQTKEFQALEDHQLEAAAETFDNSRVTEHFAA